MGEPIFEIAGVTPSGEDTWLVEGRAYQDIRTGDRVLFTIAATAESMTILEFDVVDIITYGKYVSELSRGMTGGLLLRGKDGHKILEGDFLRRERPMVSPHQE